MRALCHVQVMRPAQLEDPKKADMQPDGNLPGGTNTGLITWLYFYCILYISNATLNLMRSLLQTDCSILIMDWLVCSGFASGSWTVWQRWPTAFPVWKPLSEKQLPPPVCSQGRTVCCTTTCSCCTWRRAVIVKNTILVSRSIHSRVMPGKHNYNCVLFP